MSRNVIAETASHDLPLFDDAMVQRAREALAIRRRRERVFAPGLFGEPAWDMLLDLVVAEGEGKTLSISSLCMAAAVPQTTALRWLNYLVEAGLLLRTPNLNDSRSTFVRLTPKARRLMRRALAPLDPA